VAAEAVCAPPGVEEAEDRPHRRLDRRAQAEVEAGGLHPVRPGAEVLAIDPWGPGAEALLQVPAPQLDLAEEGVAHPEPARPSLMQ
jgi:hypothetical protein